jgi:cholinesterase
VGLQDQRQAIEWVRDNIGPFGGGPDRITLVGQSVGAASADIYSYAYTRDPIIRAFIMQSGTATAFGITNYDNLVAWWFTSAQLGCGAQADVTLEVSLSCVRGNPFTDTLAASSLAPSSSNFLGNFPQLSTTPLCSVIMMLGVWPGISSTP